MPPVELLTRSRWLPPALVLTVGLSMVAMFWAEHREADLMRGQQAYEARVSSLLEEIDHQLNAHAQILRGGVGLFHASVSVERQEWNAYVEQLQLAQQYPGLLGVGFSQVIEPADLPAHVDAIRAEGFAEYTIRPAGKRDLYTSIVYLEPFAGSNRAAFGFDMFSEPTRAAAMRRAGESGQPAMSGKVELAQGSQGSTPTGFLMYMPIYRKDRPLNTAAERWAALQGFVFSPNRMGDLMGQILRGKNLDIGFAIYDGAEIGDATRMFASDVREYEPRPYQSTHVLSTHGRLWTIHLYSRPDFMAATQPGHEHVTAWQSTMLSTLLGSALVLSLAFVTYIINRQRLMAQAAAVDLSVRTHAIVDTVVDGILTVDDAGTVETVNPAMAHIFGWSKADIVGKNIQMLMPEPYRRDHGVPMRDYVMSGPAIEVGIRREVVGRRKGGSVFPMDLAFSEMTVADKRMFTGIIRDVTERTNMEAAQRDMNASLERLVTERTAELEAQRRDKEQLLNAIGEGIYRLNRDGLVTFINPAGGRILGYAVDELIDQPMHRKCHHTQMDGQPFPLADSAVHKTLKDGQVRRIGNDVMWRKDGSMATVEYICTPLYDEEGKLAGVTVVFRDVTERRALEAQLAQSLKMEAVGQLTGGIAHDFNNLLSIIVGNLDLAADTLAASCRERPLIENALNGALRGAELVKQLMAYSRRQTLTSAVTNLNEQIANMEELLDRALGETIAVKTVPALDLWPALVDPAQFESAILNLAINARDAMPNGGTLTIETHNATLDEAYVAQNSTVTVGDYVCISISDNGIGMSPEVAERVFEPFFTTKETGKGTGLGLSMVYGYVKQSCGHIVVYSEVG